MRIDVTLTILCLVHATRTEVSVENREEDEDFNEINDEEAELASENTTPSWIMEEYKADISDSDEEIDENEPENSLQSENNSMLNSKRPLNKENKNEEELLELEEEEDDSKLGYDVKEEKNAELNMLDEENNDNNNKNPEKISFFNHNISDDDSVKKIVVPNSNPLYPHQNAIDYVRKPDYSFGYGVHDELGKNSHVRVESRDGNGISGEYRVLQPDGYVRIVKYTADPIGGFQAQVTYSKY